MHYNTSVCLVCASHSAVPDSLQPHGLAPTRLLCPWDSPGKNTGVGCHSLLQQICLTQGSNLGHPELQADPLRFEPPGYKYLNMTDMPFSVNVNH